MAMASVGAGHGRVARRWEVQWSTSCWMWSPGEVERRSARHRGQPNKRPGDDRAPGWDEDPTADRGSRPSLPADASGAGPALPALRGHGPGGGLAELQVGAGRG